MRNQLKVCFLRCSADERNIYMVGFFIVAFGLYVVMPFPGKSMPIQVECKSVAHSACGQDSALPLLVCTVVYRYVHVCTPVSMVEEPNNNM